MQQLPSAGVGVIRTGGKVAGGFWRVVGSILLFFGSKWRFTITGIFVILLCWSAINQSIKDKNAYPLVYEIGGRIVSADGVMYEEMLKLKANDYKIPIDVEGEGTWALLKVIGAKFMYLIKLMSAIWFIYFMLWAFFKLFMWHNDSEKAWNLVFAVGLFMLLSMMFSMAMIPERYYEVYYSKGEMPTMKQINIDRALAFTPLKGVFLMLYESPNLITKTFWQDYLPKVDVGFNQSGNKTINVTVNSTEGG